MSEKVVGLDVHELTDHERAVLGHLFHQSKELTRISRQLFNHANPVDEYQTSSFGADLTYIWYADYEITERIEGILVSLPVGITSATLTLGQRNIVLYSGAATTVQTLVNLNGLGMELERSDRRQLTVTGVPTTPFHVELMGYVQERYGDE